MKTIELNEQQAEFIRDTLEVDFKEFNAKGKLIAQQILTKLESND